MANKYFEVIEVESGCAVDFLVVEKDEVQERIELFKEYYEGYELRQVTGKSGELAEKMEYWYNFYRDKEFEKDHLGSVGVDSGMLMITDPCYVDKSTREACEEIYKTTDNELNSGVILNGLALALQTGHGDGMYEVYATRDEEGRILKIEIDLDSKLF
jgi:hypothetical protein